MISSNGGGYRERLAQRISGSSNNSFGPNIPPEMQQYQSSATPITRRQGALGLTLGSEPSIPMPMPGFAGVSGMGGKIGAPLISRVASPLIQRALQVAEQRGMTVASGIFEDAAAQGVQLERGAITRAGQAGKEALMNHIAEFERLGVKPQTVSKFLHGFVKRGEGAVPSVDSIASMGGNVGRSASAGMSSGEAQVGRLTQSIMDAAENAFF